MSDDLSRAMRETAEDLRPNVGKLTSGGIERGVRKRRMRRMAQIAGAAASVTAVFGAVAMVAPGSGAGRSGADVSAASGLVPAAVSTTTSAPAKPSAPPVSGEDMVKWLEQELAPYHFSDVSVERKASSEDLGGPYAVLKLGYSSGVGSIYLDVSRSAWNDQGINGTVPYVTTKTLSDGSHLMIFDGPEWPAGNGDPKAKRLGVGWYRADGTLVHVMVLNQAQEKQAVTATGLAL
ncbi:MAG: hypothetical protein JF587_21595, partial [Catenulisporales bacterium]|nr:hypothetical protein [Catenulisporales bacterium]